MSNNLLILIIFCNVLVLVFSKEASGCYWKGNMPGPGGSGDCPTIGPDTPKECPVTPAYSDLGSDLWRCPVTNRSDPMSCASPDESTCTAGTGSNPLCPDMSAKQSGCCCAKTGCHVTPKFNWILSACQGKGCGNYGYTPDTQKYKDRGSQLVVNYAAAYQWSDKYQMWIIDKDSSFNTDGKYPSFDTVKPNGGLPKASAWMAPQPGSAAAWDWGYYPAGVEGLSPPGILFVLSTEKSWNFAWYMLNQVTLDRGPLVPYPSDQCSQTNDNCWASGNAGEIDFLETPWTVNAGAADGYRRLFSTQWNQIGRCFPGTMGSTCNSDGGWFNDQACTNNYFLGSDPDNPNPQPYIYAAVVDKIGTFIYRFPGDNSTIWPGLTRTTAECTLRPRPAFRPPNQGPPCDDKNPYCAIFIPNCQADKWGGPSQFNTQGGANQGCRVNGKQGWCSSWWQQFANTDQWLWPKNDRKSVVQFQKPIPAVEMPWNYKMEANKVDWENNPIYDPGCCINNKGRCPSV
ncbi:hypothetical protein M0812_22778 [Anaeramoeba flamelloides]|uniref:C-type lectin domain-containing protein n=1 Tax=Anaeramoeba flamelloides TaxID=1746091 RepID=A0AAV7Z2H9_9EUKA|nr:hypothetical protein M0812_22778 [Anaeramoeba flamelloides]